KQSLITTLCVLWGAAQGGWAADLDLKEAERIALVRDPLVAQQQARGQAKVEEAVAVGRWPDPTLSYGVQNVPAASLAMDKDPTTQTMLAIAQEIPPLGALGHAAEAARKQADAETNLALDRALSVVRDVRKLWLDVYFYNQAVALLQERVQTYEQLSKTAQFQYRSGKGEQQDVLRAELEYNLVREREMEFQQKLEESLSALLRWLGDDAQGRNLVTSFPPMATVPTVKQLEDRLENHPAMLAAQAQLDGARQAVNAAKARRWPGWMVEIGYGKRKATDDAMVSASLRMDLPLFQWGLQSKMINARGYDVNAQQGGLDARRRDLRTILDVSFAAWTRLGQRYEHFKTIVVPQSQQLVEAARRGYQNGTVPFSDVVRARTQELDANLEILRIKVERGKAQFDLLYLTGDAT
ncbi:MAG: TolC family protein, partial [Gammaproteobacteria bacterium]|nr:TolC family protein [Gammaproteobacteria bacterium]